MKNKIFYASLLMMFVIAPIITNAAEEVFPTLEVSKTLVASGKEVTLTFGVPAGTIRSQLHIGCPAGVQVLYEDLDWCNAYHDYSTVPKEQIFKVTNSTANVQTIIPTFSIFKADRPDYSIGQSGLFAVGPMNSKIESKTGSAMSVAELKLGSKSPKKTVTVGEDKVLAEFKLKMKKGNTVLSGIYLSDKSGTLGSVLPSLEIYLKNEKLGEVTRVHDSGQVDFELGTNSILMKKGKSYSFVVKGDVPQSLIGQYYSLGLTGIGGNQPFEVKNIGLATKIIEIK